MNEIRRQKIKKYIDQSGIASIKLICGLFPDISSMTIHRDLDYLQETGQIVRVRGGAMSASLITEPKFEARDSENRIHKQAIAKKAVSLIKPGGSVFFDAGTTTTALAKIMPDIDIKIFTTAPNIALELMHLKIPTINLCGGSLNRANLALSGSFTLDMLEKINIDTAFLGVSGYDEMSGFTTGQESEAKVKSLVLKKSRTTVAMMDSTKVSRILPFTFGTLAEFTHVIVDGELSPEFVQKAAKCGVKII